VTPWWKPFVMGGVVGGLIAGYFLAARMDELQRRGSAIEAGLARLGDEYANQVARESADAYMGDVYGLTPARIAGITQLARTLGVS